MKPEDILAFWFSDAQRSRWFRSTPEFDALIKEQYLDTWLAAADEQLTDWQQTAQGVTALCIVLDQFPLNMFRSKPLAFATEAHARKVAKAAIEQGLDNELADEQKVFVYMPFMHSENIEDQHYAVELYAAAGMAENVKYANHHRGLIEQFGRFPHRNAILGRVSSTEEQAYLASPQAFLG